MCKYIFFIKSLFIVIIANGQYSTGSISSVEGNQFESANAIPLVFKMPYVDSPLYNERKTGTYENGLVKLDSLEKNNKINYEFLQEKIYLLLRKNVLNFDQAIIIYQKIKDSLKPKEDVYLKTTIQYYKNIYVRTFAESIAQLSEALKLFPGDSIFLYNRGVSYIRQNRFDLAQKDLLRATEINPADVQTLYALAFCYKWLGKPKKGLETVLKAEPLIEQQMLEDRIDTKTLYRWKLYFESQLNINEHNPKDVANASGYRIANDYNPNPIR